MWKGKGKGGLQENTCIYASEYEHKQKKFGYECERGCYAVLMGGGGAEGLLYISWKRHIYDHNDRFDLWVDMGKFYSYLLGCCLEVPPS